VADKNKELFICVSFLCAKMWLKPDSGIFFKPCSKEQGNIKE
jgi:hypothetical protein